MPRLLLDLPDQYREMADQDAPVIREITIRPVGESR
jgi:hypothetical protein